MEKARILIVEDESIVAKDIQNSLKSLGYSVPAVVSSGEEAIKKAGEIRPDLALMDIVLKGKMDGLEAARQIRDRFHIPVVYLTAYADDHTVGRAKTTEPFGYILKPFQDSELRTTIEMALYKGQMEKKLRESREWLSTTLKSIGDAVIATDQEGRVIFMNPVAQSLTGWKQEEAVGKKLEEVFHLINEETREVVESLVTEVLRAGTAFGLANHTALVARDGTEIPIDNSGAPIRDDKGQILGVVLVFHDITERKMVEKRIRHALQRLVALHGINLAITSTLDLRAVLDLLLEKVAPALSYSTATTVQLFSSEKGELEPIACRNLDEGEWRRAGWRREGSLAQVVMKTRAPLMVSDVQADSRTRDSSFFRRNGLVSYLGAPLIAQGEALGVLGFYTKGAPSFPSEDVEFLSTLAGQAAIAMHHSRLFEQTKKQALELEASNKVKSEFLSLMSHELRTPLSVIIGYATMIRDKMLSDPDKALGKIVNYSTDLLTMLDSILNVSKIEAGITAVEMREVPLGEFMDEIRSTYDVPLRKEIGLIWKYWSDLPAVKTDGAKLKHIVQNLVNNAIKYTEKGHVTVSVRYFPKTRSVEFKVADTGIGIRKDKIPIIFDMFCQVDSSKTGNRGGVGLGLYIVKKFTEMLGGKITVESRPGKGSIFTVTVPCQS